MSSESDRRTLAPHERMVWSDEEWRAQLSDEQYHVLRERGSEREYTGEHLDRTDGGTYACAGCGTPAFDSEAKYDADCGWPTFYAAREDALRLVDDTRFGMRRVEVKCAMCAGHLGHLFADGPEPSGERFTINSTALEFRPAEASALDDDEQAPVDGDGDVSGA